jgi:pimeloyl-ACP methyl ester carboxylesterase
VVTVTDGQIFVANPKELFFNDLPEDEAQKWSTNKMYPEPTEGWEKPITYMGWRDIPSSYIVCEKDNLIPAPLQETLGQLAGSTLIRMDTGHFPQLSQPEELARIIQQIASELM